MKTIKIFIVAAIMMIATGATSYAQSLSEANELYAAAVGKFQAKDYDSAVSMLKESMAMSTELGEEGLALIKETQALLPKMYAQAGIDALRAGKYDESIEKLSQASQTAELYGDMSVMRSANNAIAGAYQQKGTNAFNSKDYTTALESFSKGYELNPTNTKLANYTAKSYAELGELTKAVEIYQNVIDLGAKNSRFEADAATASQEANQYVLIALQNAGESNATAEEIVAIADLLPSSPEASLMAIQLINNKKAFKVVIERADAAAEVQTTDENKSTIYYMLGVAYNNTDQNAKAVQALAKVTAGPNVATAKSLSDDLKKTL